MTTNDIETFFDTTLQLRKLMSSRTTESHEDKLATMLQYSALSFIKDQDDVKVTDLADYLKLSKSSATQLIERLVKAKLVKRVNDKGDRRIVRLNMTSHGEKQYVILRKKLLAKVKVFTSKIPEKDLKELIRIQTNLIKTLQNES